MYDMNDVIISMGGVERILMPCGLDVSDTDLAEHLANNVVGASYTVAEVRAHEPIYVDMVVQALAEVSAPVDPVDKLKQFLLANPDVAAILEGN